MANSSGEGEWRTKQSPEACAAIQVMGATVTLKTTGAATGNDLAVVEWVLPAHHQDLWPHRHRMTNEALYVVQGALACTVNEESMVLRAGSFLQLPAGVVHHIWNPAAAPVIYLTMFVPAGPEGFYTALAEMATDNNYVNTKGGDYDYFPA